MVHSPLMIERYHLVLAAQALLVGGFVALLDRWGPSPVRNRIVAASAFAGACLGAWGNPRALPWLLPALVLVIPGDQPERSHPLGRWTVAMTVMSLAGVWSAVPDTEAPLAAGCVLVPSAVTRALGGRSVGPAASGALAIAVLGAAWVGSAGWGAALASCVAVGMVLVAPGVVGFVATPLSARPIGLLVFGHLPVALFVPRAVAFRSVPVAIAIDVVVCAWLVLVAKIGTAAVHDPPT